MKNNKEEINVGTLDISARLRNVLVRSGMTDLTQATRYTREDFLRFRNMGVITLKELEMVCEKYDIKLWSVEPLKEEFRPYSLPPEVFRNMFKRNIFSIQDFKDLRMEDIEEIGGHKKHIIQKICEVLRANEISKDVI